MSISLQWPVELDETGFDGDPDWRVQRTLPDGTRLVVRPVVPSDRDELLREFLRLSPSSHYARFHGAGPAPTEALLRYLTCVDQHDHIAIAAILTSDDLKSERGIGIARLIRLPNEPTTAEMAITVVDDMQGRGVGSLLLSELILAARARSIATVRAEVLASNDAMLHMLDRLGAKRVAVEGNARCVVLDLPIEARTSSQRSWLYDVLRAAAALGGPRAILLGSAR